MASLGIIHVCPLKLLWYQAKPGRRSISCCASAPSIKRSEQLKEWISLEAKDGDPPMVRIPHPMTAMQFEGTRKKRRAAVKDFSWSVGYKVDAWVQDCMSIFYKESMMMSYS